jgi:tetratricopeptide (TPR) repeat protein
VKTRHQKTFIILLAGFLLSPLFVLCNYGNGKIDSLERKLSPGSSKTDRFPILIQLSWELIALDLPRAKNYALQAHELAGEMGDEEKLLNSMQSLIWIYYTEADYLKALDYAVKALDMAEELDKPTDAGLACDAIGVIYDDFGDQDKSSQYFFKSLKLYEQVDDKKGMAQASSRIGVLYYKQKNFRQALEYFQISLDWSEKTRSDNGIASNLNSIANVYADQGDFQKALKGYMNALAIAVKASDLRREGSISLSIGTTYLKMKNFPMSYDYFQKALKIFQKLNNTLRIAKCQIQLGEYYLATQDYRKGFFFAEEALKHGQVQGFKEVSLNAAQLLHRLSLNLKDTLRAYRFLIIEDRLKDSLNNGEKQKVLTKLEAQYQFDKEQDRKAIKQQRMDFVTVIFIILLLSVLIILFLVWSRQKAKARSAILEKNSLEKELEFKNKEMVLNVMSLMEKKEMLIDLSERLIRIDSEATTSEGKETIRRIARELQKSEEKDILKEFALRFKEVHGAFYDKLLLKFPALSPNELKLCAFLRLNMSSKDIAALTGQRVTSLETARHRLRQKLGISNSDVNLITFLSQF